MLPDGTLLNVFTEFKNGSANIAVQHSTDKGATWSAPSVDVNADGTLAIGYYDFTNDSATDEPLLTDYWIVRSRDRGATFDRRERMTRAPFDMRLAPNAGGFFVGDYAGLDTARAQFQALYSITTQTADEPTDMIAQRATGRTTRAETGDAPEGRTAGGPRPVLVPTGPVTRN